MSRRILLIEDNHDMRDNIQEILELANYSVEAAENGKLGVQKALKSPPDLIICDIMMPEMDGYEVLYLLGKNPETSGIPFIFLTAKAERTDWRKGMNLGADDYLTKPFDEMELLNVVEMRLKRSDALKSDFSGNITDLNQFIDQASALEALTSLTKDTKKRVYKKKEIIFREGDLATGIYFIDSGKIKTYKVNNDAKEFTTGLFKKGDFIGYIPLLKNTDQPDSAVAMEDSQLYKIHKDDFLALVHNNREVAQQFIRMLSGSLMEKEQELINLAYNSVRQRVADGLLLLKNKYQETEGENFTMAVPRDDLASIVGTSTESVIRVLSDFKDEGLITIAARNITIVNEHGLANLRF